MFSVSVSNVPKRLLLHPQKHGMLSVLALFLINLFTFRSYFLPFFFFLFYCLYSFVFLFIPFFSLRPDITVMVDWALKINYLSLLFLCTIIRPNKGRQNYLLDFNEGIKPS